jgi:hypothetical protein
LLLLQRGAQRPHACWPHLLLLLLLLLSAHHLWLQSCRELMVRQVLAPQLKQS